MSGRDDEVPQADRFEDAPHPRETFAFFGHAEAEKSLLDAYRSARMPQAFILGGREGIGKATLAWRFARFVMAHPEAASTTVRSAQDLHVDPDNPAARRLVALSHEDFFLLRRSWNQKDKRTYTEIRVDDVRRAAQVFQHSAGEGGWRVVILDRAEDLNASAANALLKMIEEPPPRSLFLIIANRPGHVLPTIRSRCRTLLLQPLASADVIAAIEALAAAGMAIDQDRLAAAAARGGGSVRDTLRLMQGSGLTVAQRLDGLLARLPEVDWRDVHGLADLISGREKTDDFETLIAGVFDWLDARIHHRAAARPRELAPFAEVWDKIAASARETEALNLDRKPLVLSMFAGLAAATRGVRPD